MVHEGSSNLFWDRGVALAGSMPPSVWSGTVHSVGGPRKSKGLPWPRWSARYSRLAHEVEGIHRNLGEPTTTGYCHSKSSGPNGVS
ncbi:unnamed protein product [Linum tenue]|uniref:Uncharacterized protein n=1 Tax=Linum tenue TaxID=586396 RepID=A0AAV0HIZ1_9ROSI|nr:unnamed protein product [Linum tenue]